MRRLLLTVAGLLVVTACSSTDAAANIELELNEFAIEPSSTAYRPGTVELTATNTGEFPHTIVVEDSSGAVLTASDVIAPGATVALDVDLAGGAFQITCRIVTQDDSGTIYDHFEQGMYVTIDA